MEKINCNVIQDILTLYIDDSVSDDTKALVEEHLQNCEGCRRLYNELQEEIMVPVEIKGDNKEIKELQNFKRFLLRKRIRTILLSVVGSVICLAGIIVYMNQHITYINYKDAGITIYKEDSDSVYYKTEIRGNYSQEVFLDEETGVGTIYFKQSLWDRYVACLFYPFDHIHCILKKDQIKKMYIDSDGTETTIWEASDKEKEHFFSQDRNQPLG